MTFLEIILIIAVIILLIIIKNLYAQRKEDSKPSLAKQLEQVIIESKELEKVLKEL